MKKKSIRILFVSCLALCLGLFLWALWENTALEVNTWHISSRKLPESFQGFRIAQVSDFHNCKKPDPLPLLKECAPDIILLTGDLIDSRRTDIPTALAFVQEAVQIAPCYYVPGNHEARIEDYALLTAGLAEAGVCILENETISLTKDGQTIHLTGLTDPDFQDGKLANVPAAADSYTIVLSHRPEFASHYQAMGYDLVFTGHAHGGQIRLPLLGGLIAPGQGLLPQYDSGIYHLGSTAMVVSRGIGNSILPLRINNPPEILLAILHTEE